MSRPLAGINIPIAISPGFDPVAAARDAEALGFDFLSVNDHPAGERPVAEAWTLLTWLAAGTSTIRLATRVTGLPYRNPGMLAKTAATLDHFAPGRVILGLGGGSGDQQMAALGLAVPTAGEKMDRLAEGVDIIRGLWTSTNVSYDGRHYRTRNATIEPKPLDRIPIWLGTFGPRGLAITGRSADGWIPSLGYGPESDLPRMRERIRVAAEQAGRDPDAITCVLNVAVQFDTSPDDDGTIGGSESDIVARLESLRDMGFGGFNFVPPGPDPRPHAERLATRILPALGLDR